MKIVACILFLIGFLFASYTVQKNSITVGYCGGNADEITALHATILQLGFMAYQSGTGSAADFAAHNCQLVFNYIGSNGVSNWEAQMSGPGRGYIQCSNSGWPFFSCSRQTIAQGGVVNISGIMQGQELTTYPHAIPSGWANTHGLASYSHPNQDYLASCNEGTLPGMGTTTSGTVNCPRALTIKNNGPGKGVFYAWCNYGTSATTNDKDLVENAIIFAAQPPKADAGGPYSGNVGQPVTLDGSKSTDNVSISTYEWDINNDGTYDISVTTPTTTYTWSTPYSGLITLRCTDNILGKSTSTATVNIIGNTDVRGSSFGEVRACYH